MHFALVLALLLGAVALAGYLRPGLLSETTQGFVTGLAFGLAGMWLGFRLMPRWWRAQCDEEMQTRVSREYRRSVMTAMTIYALLLFASIGWLKRGIEPLPLRAVVAILPVLPIVWVMRAFLRYLRGIDELQRRIELEGVGVAALLVSLAYLTAGFLQQAKVIDIPSGVAMIWVFPLVCLGYAAGKFMAVRRYR